MPSSARRQAALLALALAAVGQAQTTQAVFVEFSMFSGRPRPRAEIQDAAEAQTILDSLSARMAAPVPCSEVPALPSTPLYTAAILQFAVPIVDRKTFVIHDGYIHYNSSLPCYRDPGSNLEKLAVSTAFQYPDVNAPGGLKPMEYLSCAVPDSLHAEAVPCATALRPPMRGIRGARAKAYGFPDLFTVDGRLRSLQRR
jgi:hypothetical protein